MKNIQLFLMLILLSSCEQWEIDKLPSSPSEIVVVNALLSPQDSLITVYIGQGSDLLNDAKFNKDLSRSDAKVELSGGSKTIILPFNAKTKLYQIASSKLIIQQQKSYELKVIVDDKVYMSSCTIPRNIETPTIKALFVDRKIKANLNWVESELSNKHYYLEGYGEFVSNGIPTRNSINWGVSVNNLIESSVTNLSGYDKTGFVQFSTQANRPLPELVTINVDLYSLDGNMVKYLASIKDAKDTPQQSLDFIERLQTSTIRYSNIKNGYGIMMAYNSVKISIKVKP